MPKITKSSRGSQGRDTVLVKTRAAVSPRSAQKWWKGSTQDARALSMLDTVGFLKQQLEYRYRQASINTRLYSNMPLFGMTGTSLQRMSYNSQLPLDRPTMNVIQSCVDTLTNRITQSKPKPTFLTDNGDYKQQTLAKQMNTFVMGELYQTKAYDLGPIIFRDAAVLGSGCIKIIEGPDKRVCLERRLLTELLVDPNEALFGSPRQLYELQLMDRDVAMALFPDKKSTIEKAEQAFPDQAGDSSKTVSDQIMVVEGWHLKSGPDTKDGMRMIACTAGPLYEEDYEKDKFPYIFLHYSPRMLGYFGQPLTEQLMGTQVEINKLLITISKSINLVGVPRVFVEAGSKVDKAKFNNEIGSIIPFQGTKPEYEVAPCVPAELYAQLERLVNYAYQQSGVSDLAASSRKPAGLDSGAAIREYNDLQTDRFADLNKRYDNMFIELSYAIIDLAKDIAERDGKYETIYPSKDGTQEIDLPAADLLDDSFVIQCFDSSSLPRDPAGRLQKVTELVQAGMLTVPEGKRLLDFPDLERNEKLANASTERTTKLLNDIIEKGKYTPPDPFLNLQEAIQLSNQYYNLYVGTKLSEQKAEMLRTFNTQCIALSQPPPQVPLNPSLNPSHPAAQPQANPMPTPTSPLVPNVPGAGAQ